VATAAQAGGGQGGGNAGANQAARLANIRDALVDMRGGDGIIGGGDSRFIRKTPARC
jgi:hypothetical protein